MSHGRLVLSGMAPVVGPKVVARAGTSENETSPLGTYRGTHRGEFT